MTRILYYYNIAMLAKIWYTIIIHRKGEKIMKTKLITLCLTALAAVSLLALTACGNGSALTETASEVSSFEEVSSVESETVSEVESDAIAEEPIGSVEQPVEEPVDTTANDTNAGGQTNQNYNTTYTPPSKGNVNTGGNTNVGSGNINTQQQQTVAPAQTQPTVHQPIYKQQYVVDQAAWSEEVPVYTMVPVMICNDCGAYLHTGSIDPWEHIGNHTLNGGKGSWTDTYEKQQTGTKTIFHEEIGHWENVLVCGGCTSTH